jgi:hypothetical protein
MRLDEILARLHVVDVLEDVFGAAPSPTCPKRVHFWRQESCASGCRSQFCQLIKKEAGAADLVDSLK